MFKYKTLQYVYMYIKEVPPLEVYVTRRQKWKHQDCASYTVSWEKHMRTTCEIVPISTPSYSNCKNRAVWLTHGKEGDHVVPASWVKISLVLSKHFLIFVHANCVCMSSDRWLHFIFCNLNALTSYYGHKIGFSSLENSRGFLTGKHPPWNQYYVFWNIAIYEPICT